MDLDYSRSSLERLLDAVALWLPVGCGSDPHEARLLVNALRSEQVLPSNVDLAHFW
jgi:hypothetical protein